MPIIGGSIVAVSDTRRSDDPRNTANNAGESQFLLRAAYMMMSALH